MSYDVLKGAIIELANLSPEGRNEVIAIFQKHDIPGLKAQNALPDQWPAIYDDVLAALAKLAAGDDDGSFV